MRNTLRLLLIGRLASATNGLLGACIMIAPLMTDAASRHNPAVWASLTLGGLMMFLGTTRSISPDELPLLSWINLSLGGCVLTAPWLFRFAADEAWMWLAVIVGSTVMVLAGLSAKTTLAMRQNLLSRG